MARAGGGSEPHSWHLSWDRSPWGQRPEASCSGARLLLGCGSEAPMLWERRASAREATRSPGHQRHASSRGRDRALSWEKAAPRQRTSRAGHAQEDGQPWPCVPPDTTLPARQGRTFTTPTAPHPQREGPLRGRRPPRESSCARVATEMRERKGSPGQPWPAFSSVESFFAHSPPSKAKRPKDRGPGSRPRCPQSLPRDSSALPPAVTPNTQEGPGTA